MRHIVSMLALVCAAPSAFAEPGAVSNVSSPSVTEGETKLEFRTVAFEGGALDGRWQHRAQASHGFNDFWQATLILRATQPAGDSAELTSIGLENRFAFTATRDWPVQLGGQFEYKFGVNGADDEVDFKLLAERRMGDVSARLNLNASRELADGAGWEPAYAARLNWGATDAFSIGLEAFGEPEIDAHYVGPRLGYEFGAATLAFGYLAGLDDANAEGQFRFSIEVSP